MKVLIWNYPFSFRLLIVCDGVEVFQLCAPLANKLTEMAITKK